MAEIGAGRLNFHMGKHGSRRQAPGVAVIGAGYWGKNLVRVFNELGALIGREDHSAVVIAACDRSHLRGRNGLAPAKTAPAGR